MDYGKFKELPIRTALDKLLGDKAFNFATNSKTDINRDLLQWLTNLLIKIFLEAV